MGFISQWVPIYPVAPGRQAEKNGFGSDLEGQGIQSMGDRNDS
jgi:hypothetical protein